MNPKHFCNLHSHTSYSLYDGLGNVEDHIEWVLKNSKQEKNIFALTDHGNISGVGELYHMQKKYKDKNIDIKCIYGMEAYFIPSIDDWTSHKQKQDEQKKFNREQENKPLDEEEIKTEEDTKKETELNIENEKDNSVERYDPLKRRHHLVLLAQNQKGLQNLFTLVTRSHRQPGAFYKKPRIDLNLLRQFNEGLIASSACVAGVFNWAVHHPQFTEELLDQEMLPLMEIFGPERFYLELQFNKLPEQQKCNKEIIRYSQKTGYKLIATCDSHYTSPDLWRDREIYRMVGFQMQKKDVDLSYITDKNRSDLECELYNKNADQMFEEYKATMPNDPNEQIVREAIERTYSIAMDQIEQVSPDKTTKLPKTFQVTANIKTPYDKLKSLVIKGLKEKGIKNEQYVERAVYELSIIQKLKVEDYFLTMKEIIDTLKDHMLIGSARGSGAGSMVNYLLDITKIDPIKYGLLFERFMSPSRADLPDIDTDVEQKEQSLDILKQKFGQDNVLAISNYNRLKLKSLVKDLGGLYGIDFQEINAVTKTIEDEAKDDILEEIGNDSKLYELTFEGAKKHSPTFAKFVEKHPQIGNHIEHLFKEIRSVGRHAGGILIVPEAEKYVPIVRIRGIDQCPIPEGITAQYLKYFGLVKYDILGLTTLKIIRRCIEEILISKGVFKPSISEVWEFYNQILHPDIIDDHDERVFKNVYHAGRFPSVFQFAESGVQRFCRQAKPNSVADIAVITSIWRPGALADQGDQKYVYFDKNKFDKEHPILKEILGESRGIIAYQEQFMSLAHKLAGFTLEEADKLRKLLVKPSATLAEEIKKERLVYREKFVKGCVEHGLTLARAEHLWDDEILPSCSYSFNKSHAVAYAFDSYQCAFLYTYFPRQWIKACLECDADLQKTINVSRALGFNIQKPHVNTSEVEAWNIQPDNSCVPPLVSLKGIGLTGANDLVFQRSRLGKFKSLKHFFFKDDGTWRWGKLTKKALVILIRMEALVGFDEIGPGKLFKNSKHLEMALFDSGKNSFDKIKKGKMTLEEASLLVSSDDWSMTEKMEIQKSIIGFYDKTMMLEKMMPTFEEFGIKAIDEVPDENNKQNIWFIVEKVDQKETKAGKPYLTVKVSGVTEKEYMFKVWDTSKASNPIWSEGNVLISSLQHQKEYGYNIPRYAKTLHITK